MNLKVATRKSILAKTQTDLVIDMIKKSSGVDSEKILMETLGDKILDKTLDKIGGKGLFVKEIEMALLENKADIAVHSMKDVPFDVPPEFFIAVIPEREDVRDVFVSKDDVPFMNLKSGSKVGTSSKRRAAQLKILRPDVEIVPIRGNVNTRLRKIKELNLDGTILAAAGLKRLNMENIVTNYFKVDQIIPAIGQGALGLEIKKDNNSIYELIKDIEHRETRICVETERSFMRKLNGDCHSTIGAHAILDKNLIYAVGIYEINGRIIKKDIEGKVENYKEIGVSLAKKIINA